ncbi:hypothetical protein C8J57DRAFT_1270722 [Mycena rebaudengoi]|nr:hypothetical protein C8J57DRAFT_1270722 [Mycena rebaudengoi]
MQPCCPRCGHPEATRTPLPSPPAHLSTPNDVPQDSEIHAIRDRIDTGRARLSEIDQIIDHLQSLLVPLRRERQSVLENIEQHLAIISPIRSLPYDVLGEIFSWTLPQLIFCSIEPSQNPWAISRVCTRWRKLALSLPELWSYIRVDGHERFPLALLDLQLERSGRFPLSIAFFSGMNAMDAFKLLIEHSDRWRTVQLRLQSWMCPLLDLNVTGRLPLLRSLITTYSVPREQHMSSCKAFEIAPSLQHVIITSLRLDLPVPYAQLVRLRSVALPTSSLRLAHNLRELTLFGHLTTHEPGPLIELPHLRVLQIHDGKFLEDLVLPALEDIYVFFQPLSLISLVHRSSCAVRKLIALYATPAETVELLEHIPTLAELICQDPTMSIVSRLALPSAPAPDYRLLGPALRSLHILCSFSADYSKIAQLESRHKSTLCPPLSLSFYDRNSKFLPPRALDMQSSLRERGMDIEWFAGEDSWEHAVASFLEAYP